MPKNYLNIKQELIEGTWHGSIVSPWSHTLVLGFMSGQCKVHMPSNIKFLCEDRTPNIKFLFLFF